MREGDAESLAHVLLERTSNPDGLAAIARNGAEAVRQKFQQSVQTKTLEDYYLEAMASPKAVSS
ncbi:MAG: hypothetical protein LC642_05850 [Verrucomicrobiaceae bacterium]|nr:hypothetical protein [Verrucomicrobiaceae bacterium]